MFAEMKHANFARFESLCQRLGIRRELTKRAWDALNDGYKEPHRHYHNLGHIESMLTRFDDVGSTDDRLEMAIWFHDAVYEPTQADNEDNSAKLFQRLLEAELDSIFSKTVVRLILATRHGVHRPELQEEALMVDLDLSILAAPRDEYLKYSRAIREEYGHVLEEAFNIGRAAVLRGFLDRNIYTTPLFCTMEETARQNLIFELSQLGDFTNAKDAPQ